MALIDLIAPVVKTTDFGFTAKKVEILLPHKVLGCVDGVTDNRHIRSCSEYSISFVSHQREGSVRRTEVIVSQFRRNRVEATTLDIAEPIVAVIVRNRRRGASAGKSHD